MAEINSPLGRASFQSQSRKVYTVEDESSAPVPQNITIEQFRDFQNKKNEAKQASKKITSEAKLRVELLTGIGRLKSDIIIDNHKFSLQSLKSGEIKEIMKVVSNAGSGTDALYEMKVQVLGRALYAIDDQNLSDILGTNNLEDYFDFLNEMQDSVTTKLYNFYTDLIKNNENKLSVNSVEQAQEVIEEIKKA